MLDGRREMVKLDLLDVVGAVEEDVVGGAELVVGGAEDDGAGAALDEPLVPEPALESPVLKTTMLAVWPFGMVTTQNWEPPAPLDLSALVTPPIPSLDGSMEQGVPLQPEPAQTILIPNVGGVPAREEPCQIGFHAILKKVLPLASVLPPATYGAQFPMGLSPLPQIHASPVPTPGGLM